MSYWTSGSTTCKNTIVQQAPSKNIPRRWRAFLVQLFCQPTFEPGFKGGGLSFKAISFTYVVVLAEHPTGCQIKIGKTGTSPTAEAEKSVRPDILRHQRQFLVGCSLLPEVKIDKLGCSSPVGEIGVYHRLTAPDAYANTSMKKVIETVTGAKASIGNAGIDGMQQRGESKTEEALCRLELFFGERSIFKGPRS